MATKSKASQTAVWIIILMLIVGLAGFGATNFSHSVDSIGKVGDRDIGAQRYYSALQNRLSQLERQFGTRLPFAQAQQLGLDQAVLQELVATVAVEAEAQSVGLSVGDMAVRDEILTIPAFQGLDGSFNREAYRDTLQRNNMNEERFEDDLRAELSRTLLQGAVAGGVTPSDTYTTTLMDYAGERRSFAWAVLGEDDLPNPLVEPTEEQVRAYFDGNPDDFMLPETRATTYVWLTPDMIQEEIEVPEDQIRALYEERIDDYVRPERRLVERLILGDAAADAKARLDAGDVTFEALVAERELDLADVDMGDVTQESLGDAGAAVFATDGPGIVGPVDSPFGAALYRVNAILAPQETSFEAVRDTLRAELALELAQDDIVNQIDEIDDLLAGGASLEDLAQETALVLGQIDWSAETVGGIADAPAFRDAVRAAAVGDFPELVTMANGGLFALRLNEVIAPRVDSFENAQARATDATRAAALAEALEAHAETLAAELRLGQTPENLVLTQEENRLRTDFIDGTPAGFMIDLFEMDKDEVRVLSDGAAYLIQLADIAPRDPENTDITSQGDRLRAATAASLAQDVYDAYATAVEGAAGIALNQVALNALHAQIH